MKKMYVTISMAAFSVITHAQSVSPEVIATSGQQFQNGQLQLEWTLGEVVTETESNGNAVLTQGFHQPEIKITGLEDLSPDWAMSVFPNPTSGLLNVQFEPQTETLQFSIIDLGGKQVLSSRSSQSFQLHLEQLAPGSYFLNVRSQNGSLRKTYQILKTH